MKIDLTLNKIYEIEFIIYMANKKKKSIIAYVDYKERVCKLFFFLLQMRSVVLRGIFFIPHPR